jgi:hypothetical protein
MAGAGLGVRAGHPLPRGHGPGVPSATPVPPASAPARSRRPDRDLRWWIQAWRLMECAGMHRIRHEARIRHDLFRPAAPRAQQVPSRHAGTTGPGTGRRGTARRHAVPGRDITAPGDRRDLAAAQHHLRPPPARHPQRMIRTSRSGRHRPHVPAVAHSPARTRDATRFQPCGAAGSGGPRRGPRPSARGRVWSPLADDADLGAVAHQGLRHATRRHAAPDKAQTPGSSKIRTENAY